MKKLLTIPFILIAGVCFGQFYSSYEIKRPTPVLKNGHRLHQLGVTLCSNPPIYTCVFCDACKSPENLLPDPYSSMYRKTLIPFFRKDSVLLFIGYDQFTDSLRRNKINEDDYFIDRWNEIDTTCISHELKCKSLR